MRALLLHDASADDPAPAPVTTTVVESGIVRPECLTMFPRQHVRFPDPGTRYKGRAVSSDVLQVDISFSSHSNEYPTLRSKGDVSRGCIAGVNTYTESVHVHDPPTAPLILPLIETITLVESTSPEKISLIGSILRRSVMSDTVEILTVGGVVSGRTVKLHEYVARLAYTSPAFTVTVTA